MDDVTLPPMPEECEACCGKSWNDEWRKITGHYSGGEYFRILCDSCGGTGSAAIRNQPIEG